MACRLASRAAMLAGGFRIDKYRWVEGGSPGVTTYSPRKWWYFRVSSFFFSLDVCHVVPERGTNWHQYEPTRTETVSMGSRPITVKIPVLLPGDIKVNGVVVERAGGSYLWWEFCCDEYWKHPGWYCEGEYFLLFELFIFVQKWCLW